MQTVQLKAPDGVRIAADYYESADPVRGAVYTHMMPATKESWAELAEHLVSKGISGIAIDLRGHGASDGGPDGYKDFEEIDHRVSIRDIEAAAEYLRAKGILPEKISFLGASIGANLSLEYIVEHPEHKCAILLSPGLNYKGLQTVPLAQRLKADQRVFFISARDDERAGGNNARQTEQIMAETAEDAKKEIKIYETGGHGTEILFRDKGLFGAIYKFISE